MVEEQVAELGGFRDQEKMCYAYRVAVYPLACRQTSILYSMNITKHADFLLSVPLSLPSHLIRNVLSHHPAFVNTRVSPSAHASFERE